MNLCAPTQGREGLHLLYVHNLPKRLRAVHATVLHLHDVAITRQFQQDLPREVSN